MGNITTGSCLLSFLSYWIPLRGCWYKKGLYNLPLVNHDARPKGLSYLFKNMLEFHLAQGVFFCLLSLRKHKSGRIFSFSPLKPPEENIQPMQSLGASHTLGCQAAGCCTPGQWQPLVVTEVTALQLLLTDVSHFQSAWPWLWLCVSSQYREWWTWVWALAHLWNGARVPDAPDTFRRESVGEDP